MFFTIFDVPRHTRQDNPTATTPRRKHLTRNPLFYILRADPIVRDNSRVWAKAPHFSLAACIVRDNSRVWAKAPHFSLAAWAAAFRWAVVVNAPSTRSPVMMRQSTTSLGGTPTDRM